MSASPIGVRRAQQPSPAWLLALCLGLPLSAAAQGYADYEHVGRLEDARRQPSPLVAGPHTFEPSINYRILGISRPHVYGLVGPGWTDNLLRQDSETPGVDIRAEPYVRLMGGTRLDTEIYDHRVELSYEALATEYLDTGQTDTLEHLARGRLDLFWTDLEAHADLRWRRAAYPQSIQLTGIVRTQTLYGRVWAEARVGRIGVRVAGRATDTEFLDSDLQDLGHRTYGADVQVYGRLRPKLRGILEYNFTSVVYERGRRGSLNDYTLHQLRGGLDGKLTPKLTGSLKAGFGVQDVDVETSRDDREFTGLVATISLRYRPLVRTTFIAAYSRTLLPSTRSNFLRSDDVIVRWEQVLVQETLTSKLEGGYNRSRLTGGSLNQIRAGASLIWRITRWMSVVAKYEFVRLESTFAFNDYRVHTVSLSLGIGL